MLYLIALLAPWLAVMLRGKFFTGVFLGVLQLTMVGWIPATIVAWIIIGTYKKPERGSSRESGGSGKNTAFTMMLRYYIPFVGEEAKEEYKASILEIAAEEGLNPDFVMTSVSGAVLIDKAKRTTLRLNHDHYWIIDTDAPWFDRRSDTRIELEEDDDGTAWAIIAKAEEIDELEAQFKSLRRSRRAAAEGKASLGEPDAVPA